MAHTREIKAEPGTDLWDNPMGTRGFEFVEYTAEDPVALGGLFETMGFRAVARHRSKAVTHYSQGGVNFIVNAEPKSFAQSFAKVHGPSVCAIAESPGYRREAPLMPAAMPSARYPVFARSQEHKANNESFMSHPSLNFEPSRASPLTRDSLGPKPHS